MFKNRKKAIWIVMIAAFIAGILFVNLTMEAYLEKETFTLQRILATLEKTKKNKQTYLYFLTKRRMGNYLILGLLGETVAGQIGLILYGCWFCVTEGICFTAIFLQNGISGIWSMILLQIPHMVCYGTVYVQLIKKWTMEKKGHFIIEWLWYLPLIIGGIGIECYVSPWVTEVIKRWLL